MKFEVFSISRSGDMTVITDRGTNRTTDITIGLNIAFFACIGGNNNNNNNNNNVSLLQLQTNAAKDNRQHLPRRTVHYNRIHTKNTRSSAR